MVDEGVYIEDLWDNGFGWVLIMSCPFRVLSRLLHLLTHRHTLLLTLSHIDLPSLFSYSHHSLIHPLPLPVSLHSL